MNYFKNLNVFSWKKPNYSEFYLATLSSFFIFSLAKTWIINVSKWGINALESIFVYSAQPGETWYMLLCICFLLEIALMTFIIQPLGFRTDELSKNSWETFISALIILGFFVFVVSLVFVEVPLPQFPLWMIRILQPASSLSDTEIQKNFWSFVPWIWGIAPLAVFYYSVLTNAKTIKSDS